MTPFVSEDQLTRLTSNTLVEVS